MATILDTLQNELRRVTVAGAGLAAGDNKLSGLASELKKAGSKVPVLAKLAEQTEKVTERGNPADILDESVLLTSIAYTQAATGALGDLASLPSAEFTDINNASYRSMRDLISAFTTKGSGRYELIKQGIEDGTVFDMRFMRLMVDALEDGFTDIGHLVAQHLPRFGPSVKPLILEKLDIKKGTEANLRRLQVIAAVSGDEAEEFFLDIYKNAVPKLRHVAIRGLTDEKYDHIHMDALKSKNADVLHSAYFALAKRTDAKAQQMIDEGVRGVNYVAAVDAVIETNNPHGITVMRDELRKYRESETLNYESLYMVEALLKHSPELTYEEAFAVFKLALDPAKWSFAENIDSARRYRTANLFKTIERRFGLQAVTDSLDYMKTNRELFQQSSVVYNLLESAMELYSPAQFYEAFHKLAKHSEIKERLIVLFMRKANISQYNFDRDALKQAVLNGTKPTKAYNKLKPLDPRWFDLISENYEITALTIPDKPDTKKYISYFEELTARRFEKLSELSVFYWCAWAYLALDRTDLLEKLINKMENVILDKDVLITDTLRGLSRNLEASNVFSAYSWFSALVEMMPERFAEIFEKMKNRVEKDENKEYLHTILELLGRP